MPARSLTVSVDRIEGRTVVLEGDDGRRFEARVRDFSHKPREGMIYSVPLDRAGDPVWKEAAADHDETDRRRVDLQRRTDALRKRDQGEDVEL
jgi:hypothetical protein